MTHDHFELRRLSDELVYQFDVKLDANGTRSYRRRDQDLDITYWQKILGLTSRALLRSRSLTRV